MGRHEPHHQKLSSPPRIPTRKIADKEGLPLAAVTWIKGPRNTEPIQILTALDESTAAALRMHEPAVALVATMAALTSTKHPPPQLTILREKLRTTTPDPKSINGPLSSYPLELQTADTLLYNVMMRGDLIWVYETNADDRLIIINTKQHTLRTDLRKANGSLYIGNMCPDQEPLQTLAVI